MNKLKILVLGLLLLVHSFSVFGMQDQKIEDEKQLPSPLTKRQELLFSGITQRSLDSVEKWLSERMGGEGINFKNLVGMTPVDWAVWHGCPAIFSLLYHAGGRCSSATLELAKMRAKYHEHKGFVYCRYIDLVSKISVCLFNDKRAADIRSSSKSFKKRHRS